jgi:Epoxide hydrolase N terminus
MIALEAVTHTRPSLSSTRRSFLRTLTAAGAVWRFLLAAPGSAETIPSGGMRTSFDSLNPAKAASDGEESIRPFQINFPEAAIVDLRRRIAATKWPERETVADATQGVQLATMRELARYWQTGYN